MVKKRFSSPTLFCNGREHIAFSHGQKPLSNQLLHNLHFTEDEESMKEHTLVRFPLMYYLWNAKRAKVFNFQPNMTRSIDSRGWKRKVRFSEKKKNRLIWGKKIHSLSCLTRVYLCAKIETIWIFDSYHKISFLFDFCTDVLLSFHRPRPLGEGVGTGEDMTRAEWSENGRGTNSQDFNAWGHENGQPERSIRDEINPSGRDHEKPSVGM